MTFIIDGTAGETFPDSTTQSTSALIAGKTPYSALPAGSVLQVIQGSTSSQTSTTSSTLASTGLSATITPKFSTSKILILVSIADSYQTTSSYFVSYSIYRNSTNIAPTGSSLYQGFGGMYITSANPQMNINFSYLDSPATASATTYTVYFATTGGFAQINANGQTSFIQLLEVAA